MFTVYIFQKCHTVFSPLLSAFATLRKATISFVFSVRQHKARLSHEILYLRIVRKSVNKIQV